MKTLIMVAVALSALSSPVVAGKPENKPWFCNPELPRCK
jgi:hypothetical protein